MGWINKLLYERKKKIVSKRRFNKHPISFKHLKFYIDFIKDKAQISEDYRSANAFLMEVLVNRQKAFRVIYIDDDDVFNMIEIINRVKNNEGYYIKYIHFKLINDLKISNSELYLKYKLLIQ